MLEWGEPFYLQMNDKNKVLYLDVGENYNELKHLCELLNQANTST